MKNVNSEFKRFRAEFAKAVTKLEEEFEIEMKLGNINYDDSEFRVKITAKNLAGGVERTSPINFNTKTTRPDFIVGDVVHIIHKKVNPEDEFEVIKINRKSVKVKVLSGRVPGGIMKAHPSLIQLKSK